MIDNCNIKNLAKNQVSAVFHLRAIRKSVLPKFTEPGARRRHVCALRRDTNMAAGNRQKHLSLSFATKA